MLELLNSHERDLQQWTSLFQAAEKRFRLQGVKRPSGSRLSFLEFKWENNVNSAGYKAD